ncbi:hypothetical protein BGX21_001641 [Mortierella sp. AD011]|nr:hypothetical protein BGX20_000656 [Mortierella sp. AD010]KAF9383130.1 hypothetical protein BGX21_001641 [Mortierella sp. AD011]
MRKVEVNVVKVRNLKRQHAFRGSNDPYVRIAPDRGLIHHWQKTNTIKDAGAEAEFDKQMTFEVKPDGNLLLEVKDSDLIHDDEIGRTKIPMSDVFETGAVECWYQIGEGSKYSGEVYLQMRAL